MGWVKKEAAEGAGQPIRDGRKKFIKSIQTGY